jgi:hypothetical protein
MAFCNEDSSSATDSDRDTEQKFFGQEDFFLSRPESDPESCVG